MSYASLADVDKAVAAAKDAFENGEWGRMNARERGRLMYRCAFWKNNCVISGSINIVKTLKIPTKHSMLNAPMEDMSLIT